MPPSAQLRAALAVLALAALLVLFHLGDRLVKRLVTLAAACAAVLAIGGCQSPGSSGPHAPANPAVTAEVAAETAFNAAANAELDAKATGLLVGDKAVQADDVRHRAYAALVAIRTAYQMGQAFDATQLTTFTNQLLIASGKLPPAAAQPAGH